MDVLYFMQLSLVDEGSDGKSVNHEGLGQGEIAYTGLQLNKNTYWVFFFVVF